MNSLKSVTFHFDRLLPKNCSSFTVLCILLPLYKSANRREIKKVSTISTIAAPPLLQSHHPTTTTASMSGVTNQEEDRKPAADQSGHINLKVKGQVF